MKIRQATINDAKAIIDIYNPYIKNTIITFEDEPVSVSEMENRLQEKLEKYDWLVAEIDNEIIGYAYYSSFRTRIAYQHTVETTIYLSGDSKGKGCGTKLYSAMIESAKAKGFRELMAVVSLPNPESIGFHKKMGFAEVGIMKNIGYKFNDYIDVSFLQKSIGD